MRTNIPRTLFYPRWKSQASYVAGLGGLLNAGIGLSGTRCGILALWLLQTTLTALGQASLPPQILPNGSPQSQAAFEGSSAQFSVTALGSAGMSYQWRLDGQDLPNQTNQTLSINAARPVDEGDYTVAVSNSTGSVTNDPPARLYVVPNSPYTKGNFTNTAGLRLPYFYRLPTNYVSSRAYPLVLYFHGVPGDEIIVPSGYFPTYAAYHVFSSCKQQTTDPAIVVWPCRRVGDTSWTDEYIQEAAELVDDLISRFGVDTNRVYVSGGSEGVHAAWDLIGLRSGLFAGARLGAGWAGGTPPAELIHTPIWATCSAQDDQLASTQELVSILRYTGAKTIFTLYGSGTHLDTIAQAWCTPQMVDWLLAQRLGREMAQPSIAITSPGPGTELITASAQIRVTGIADAPSPVTQVSWANVNRRATGIALGTNLWTIDNLVLLPERTNEVIVTGTTSSWAPIYGGSTTFSATLNVFSSPIRVSIAPTTSGVTLNWVGGAPPFQIQQTINPATGTWESVLTNASAPTLLNPDPDLQVPHFYRVFGH